MKKSEIARYIDHTILKAVATEEDVALLCEEAKKYNFASVCVNPANVKFASKMLVGSDVKTCTVIGFPLGANTVETKVFETKDAVKNGAEEIDMVINVGKLKSGDVEYVENEIKAVVEAASGNLVKVIIETCYLTDDEKVAVSKAVTNAKAEYIKTSTGFGTGGATTEDVALMSKNTGAEVKVKASGGIRDYESALKMIDAGAERIGTSAGIKIFEAAE